MAENDSSGQKPKVAGRDLGEIHAVTVATEDKALLVSGRAIRSISQFHAKIIGRSQQKCKTFYNWKCFRD